jgi:transcriptional regulator GlxA family with amidase domain
VHEPGEYHADHFQADALMVNVELDDDGSVEEALRVLGMTNANAAAPAKPEWLERVLRNFDWVGAPPLHAAAQLADIHPTHFARAFHRCMGVTANTYRRRCRVDAASALLLDSDRSLVRIAHASGFCDQSHFSNAFRATSGMTPLEFRRAFVR